MVLYLAVTLAVCLLARLVYRYDLYEKEPWYLLLLAAALGFGAMELLGFVVEDRTIAALQIRSAVGLAAVAAVEEEATKLLLVLLLWRIFPRHFNDPMDGLIYGAFAGLGMAAAESLFYLDLNGQMGAPVVGAEAVRLILHLLMGGIGGFALGLVFFRRRRRWLAVPAIMALSLALHFFWDALVGLPVDGNPLVQRVAAVVLMATALASFGALVVVSSRWSRQQFAP